MSGYVIISFGRGHTICCEEQHFREGVSMHRIPRACTVRNWGTTKGLGEIAAHGPTKDTILDAIPFPLRIPADAVHLVLDCSEKASNSWHRSAQEAEKNLLKG